jgi:L,D-transpeptidase catalytic domain
LVSGSRSRILLAVFLSVVLVVAVTPAAAAAAAGNPSAPYGLEVTTPASSAGGCLKLTWHVDDPSGVTQYRVYRSAKPDSGFRLVHTEDVQMDSGSLMDHFDDGLKDGSTYYYSVALVGRDGRETGRTAAVRGQLPERTAVAGGYPGKHIIISIADQVIYFLDNDVLVKSHVCSTGVDSKPTPVGAFVVQWHAPLVVSEKYGGAYCYWWMNFAPDTGMHALPYNPGTHSWTGAASLGHKASHGCVRQWPGDAQWAYNWTPDGTRVDVSPYHWEPPPPPPPPMTGGHASQGISGTSTDWYMAEGYTGGSFDEYVLMFNPTPTAANVQAEFMKPDGTVVNGSYTVGPATRFTVHVDEIPGLEDAEVSTHLRSDQPITAERSMYFMGYAGKDGGTCSAAVPAPAKTWYLAEGYTGGDFDEFILVQNPGDTADTVHVEYMTGDTQFGRDYPVGAHSRASIHVDDIPELASADVSARVTCGRPVVVERSQYFNYYGRDDGNASAGVTAPGKKWYFAEGYTGGEFDEYVLLQNPGGIAGKANVTFMCTDGQNVTRTYDLAPHRRFTIHVDEIPGLESRDVSTYVDADVDVVAERSMYFSYYGKTGGSDAPGVTSPAPNWYMAEGYTGGDYDTFILVMNPSDKPVNVAVSFVKPSGEQKRIDQQLAPNSRYTVHVDEIEGLTDAEFSTAVSGLDGPIICERAMYFSVPR